MIQAFNSEVPYFFASVVDIISCLDYFMMRQ